MQTGDTALVTVRAFDDDGRSITDLPAGMEPVVTVSDPSILQVLPGRVVAIGSGSVDVIAAIGAVSGRTSMRVNPTTLNLSAVVHFNQVVQNAAGSVLLVPGRAGLMRIFVRADRANFLPLPAVRVRLFMDDAEIESHLLTRAGFDVPTSPPTLASEGWNVHVPEQLMRPGLGWILEIDPDGTLPRADDGPVIQPASGIPQRVEFVDVPTLPIRFVPIHHDGIGTGNITSENVDDYLSFVRALHPVVEIERDVRMPYTPLVDPASPNYWDDLVFEIDMLRVAEGSGRYYYGIAPGTTGRALLGKPTAVSFDTNLPNFASTVAHELGHNFGRLHSSTCTPGDPYADTGYPYANGTIGAIGYDAETRTLIGPDAAFDIMNACGSEFWISDYNFSGAMQHRRFVEPIWLSPAGTGSLLVWGSIEDGLVTLRPAFVIDAGPQLPRAPGAYLLEGLDHAGRVLFAHSFDPDHDAHDGDVAGFTFAIPLDFPVESLAVISVRGRGTVVEARRPAEQLALRMGSGGSTAFARRIGAGIVEVGWDPTDYDVAIVMDAGTGTVIGVARGGSVRVRTEASELELRLSDGVAGPITRIRAQ